MGKRSEDQKAPGVMDFMSGGGEMGARMRAFDWSASPLGPIRDWPQSLKTSVRIMLTSRQAMFVWWGPQLINLYNDAYKSIVGGKHPEALGQPASLVWHEIWDQVGPRAESAMVNNEGTYDESLLLIMERNGYPEETYYTFSYSPVPNDEGGTGGIICANTDDTQTIVGERQLALLRELAARTVDARTFDEACNLSASCLKSNPYDLPFAMIYLIDSHNRSVFLAGACGIERGHPAAPETSPIDGDSVWPFAEVIRTNSPCLVSDLGASFDALPTGAWQRPPHQATAVPIAPSGQTGKAGILIAGVNPYRLFDGNYRRFIDLVSAQIAASIGNAQAYEEERKRAEALAELDRAKTLFFSNVSHEFRTPLTLMLGPLEDVLAKGDDGLPPEDREQIAVAHRNSLRLLKLVNTLLDFSRIEAGRVQASYEPCDLSALTSDLASVFRSTVERAGIRYVVDCPPLPEHVYVDCEMWEKVVLNLLSNAFKFTFEGRIEVSMHSSGEAAEMVVRDTGIGIPPEEMPNLFERFHRVEGARGRSLEGTGIGLALVQELVRLHGGSVRVESDYGRGTAFIVSVPFGCAHLPPDRIQAARTVASTALRASAYVEEASRWLPNEAPRPGAGGPDGEGVFDMPREARREAASGPRARILLADDNADMRDYAARLLSTQYEVDEAADGEKALLAARARKPDLVLTDIMMPNLDGFGLLRALRDDPRTRTTPVILLSARAGEESRVEGLEAGADDYLVKPFSARELLARVRTHLSLASIRRETQKKIIDIWESITDGFIALDRDWRYIYINAEAHRMGLNRAELLGRTVWEAFPDIIGTDIETNFRRAVSEQATVEFETHYDAWGKWFESKVFPSAEGGLAVYFRDITKRKLAEQARRESEERFAKAFSASPLILTISSLVTGKLIEVNETFVNVSGYSREQAIGKTTIDLGLWASTKDREEELGALRESGKVRQAEYLFRMRDGRELVGLLSAEQIEIGGEPCALTVIQDITERKRVEEERERLFRSEQAARFEAEQAQLLSAELLVREQEARAQAEAANRSKDEFLATVSHELRTPLNAILGWITMLRGGKIAEDVIPRSLETIERNARSQARLIEDLLDVSSIITGKLRLDVLPVDLGSVIEAAVDVVRPAADAKGIRLQLLLDSNAGPVSGDPERLQQVVWNLLSNAVKFTPKGGRVQVRLERVNSHIEIIVSDTGPGIDSDFLPYVFDRFRQADSSYTRKHGGLGLGLAIVRHLVELHGGTVSAHNRGDGQGSTFVVRLPIIIAHDTGRFKIDLLRREEADMSAASMPNDSPRLDGLHLILVEDEPDARDIVKMMLEQCGATVMAAASAGEGLRMLEESQPDALISDIEMREEDGYSFIGKVRALEPGRRDIPAIALTAHAQPQDRLRALAAGFDSHVAKPVELIELTTVIASVTRRKKRV
ncbi:MAG TPA: ATP-binding protein [Blastocatellia bacterium]|nr:ATP-binding protein [Blastocatellia bacterium]